MTLDDRVTIPYLQIRLKVKTRGNNDQIIAIKWGYAIYKKMRNNGNLY